MRHPDWGSTGLVRGFSANISWRAHSEPFPGDVRVPATGPESLFKEHAARVVAGAESASVAALPHTAKASRIHNNSNRMVVLMLFGHAEVETRRR